MTRYKTLIASVLVGGALAASLTACSSAPEENSAAACDAYGAFVDAVTEAKGSLTTSSTIGEITDARDSVKSAYANLDTAMADVAQDRQDALEEAWTAFDKAVTNVDQDLTVQEAADSLADDLAGVETAQSSLNDSLVCN